MIVRAFNITIAKASMPYTVTKAIHSDAEKSEKDKVSFCC